MVPMLLEKRGFTLIELIISIAILAILVAVLVVAINPAEQLARSRDAKRVADLDALKSALNLYLATATTTVSLDGGASGSENLLCKNGTAASLTLWVNTTGLVPTSTFTSQAFPIRNTSSGQAIGSSTGSWLPARFDYTPGGSPISVLPLDPTGRGTGTAFYYSYACEKNNKQFEFGAMLESTYFNVDLNLDGVDGGASSTRYEVGSNMSLL